ncbi:MAG: asparagine--tRNA ligase [Deltaproteobacteria bacterium]|nr:asparagine--tRNA ligase [Deltaproteobacteria bacterium]
MPIVPIHELAGHVGQSVTVRGWLYNRRSSKKLHFLEVRDGFGIVQCVVAEAEAGDELFARAGTLTQEDTLGVTGTVRAHPRRAGELELAVTGIEVLARTVAPYPISPKEHGTEFLMDHRHLWLRSRRQHAALRVRHTVVRAIRDFFDERDFTLIDAPIFTPSACEGTSTLFQTDFHGQPAYLSQSGQLYMEAAAAAFGKVYCFGPTFRAEKSKTRRHLAEFWMVEPEVAFADLDGAMDLAEDMLCSIVTRVLGERRSELATLERDIGRLDAVVKPFPRIGYDEAIRRLAEAREARRDPAAAPAPQWGQDLGAEDETVLSEGFDRPVMVHRYPAAVKAFYMKRDPLDPRLALGVDVLAPEGYGEIVGGGQREDDLGRLLESLREHGLPQQAFEWYLDLRRYGTFPHAGFGLGLERTVAWLCGLGHLRETVPFPRMLTRLGP